MADFNDLMKVFGISSIGGGAGGLLASLFSGDPSAPYKAGMDKMKEYTGQAASFQNPFYSAGTAAIPEYQDWLKGMSDPTKFINDIMGQYTESPYSKYEQDQAMRAAKNMGSASGLTGSTPLQLQAQENASNIANKDMERWLQDVLGINTQYGSGLQREIGSGQESANQLTRLFSELARQLSAGAFGSKMADMKNTGGMFGDLASIGTGIGSLFF